MHVSRMVFLAGAVTIFLYACTGSPAPTVNGDAASEWPTVGGNPSAQRYSELSDIQKTNVSRLRPAWTYHSGDASKGDKQHGGTALEVTPIMVGDSLYFCTPFNRIISLDAESGAERWKFDSKANLNGVYTPVCRGVAYWHDEKAAEGVKCRNRIFMGTVDAKLWAVDAADGLPCKDFGDEGRINLLDGIGEVRPAEYYPTSAPLVIDGLVVIGAFVKDVQRLHAPGGAVRAFDTRNGELKWVWDPVPPD